MKKNMIYFVAGVFTFSLLSFKVAEQMAGKESASVEQIKGVYVFIHSKPNREYEYLGSFHPKAVPSGNAKPIVNHMISKGTEKYPQADGIIFTDDQLAKVDMIKFK